MILHMNSLLLINIIILCYLYDVNSILKLHKKNSFYIRQPTIVKSSFFQPSTTTRNSLKATTEITIVHEEEAYSYFTSKPNNKPVKWKDVFHHISEKLSWDDGKIFFFFFLYFNI